MQPNNAEAGAPDRITTGVPRLDEILDGGIPRHAVVFVNGLPGTGKTILSQQAVFANARAGRTSLYLTTLSEPPLKLLRFLQGFAFFDPELFGTRVIYGDLGSALRREGTGAILRELDQLVRDHRPAIVVIDSFKVFRDFVRDPLAYREFTLDLSVRLSAWEITALLVGEYSADDLQEGPEFGIADGIIYLYGTEEAERQKRFLRVMKMRGTHFFAGEHFFDIGPGGITLYPRLVPEVAGEYQFPGGRAGSAVEGMDEMLGGGLFESTSTLISGATGSGKTLLAQSFLVEGARRGEPGLLVSFEESARQIARNSEALGWDLEDLIRRGLLDVFHVSPAELNIDRHAFMIKERLERLGARRLVIDSMSAFEAAVPNLARYQSYVWGITDYCKRSGITLIMTSEVKNPFEPLEISGTGISFVSDNIIVLRYVELYGEIKRAVGVLKMRGSAHERYLRELVIDPPRIMVGPRMEQAGMLGVAMRRTGEAGKLP